MDHTEPHVSQLGERIRLLRADRGLTIRGLHRRCKEAGHPVSWSQLSKIERGICDPWEPTVLAIATGLGTTVAQLCGHVSIEEPRAAKAAS